MIRYTAKQIDMVLDAYFRDQPRPMPWRSIASLIGEPMHDPDNALSRLVWKLTTGYTKSGRRREYRPTSHRANRTARPWFEREITALRAGLAGEGQEREPKVDAKYMAKVLARPLLEVEDKWREINADCLGRKGFFS